MRKPVKKISPLHYDIRKVRKILQLVDKYSLDEIELPGIRVVKSRHRVPKVVPAKPAQTFAPKAPQIPLQDEFTIESLDQAILKQFPHLKG